MHMVAPVDASKSEVAAASEHLSTSFQGSSTLSPLVTLSCHQMVLQSACSSVLRQAAWMLGNSCGRHRHKPQVQMQVAARWFSVSGITQTSPTKLHEVMKTEVLAGKTPEQISDIWVQYHSDPSKGRAGSVISSEDWQLISERGKKSPMFVLPLAKPQGYLTLVTQHQLPFTLVTSLEEFRRFGPSAPACMMITHYTELLDSAKVVLVRADIVNDKLVNTAEARTVLELLRAFYTNADDYKAVLDFNHNQQAFDFSQLLTKLGIKTEGTGSG